VIRSLLAAGLLSFAGAAAHAHARLESAEPPAGGVLVASPKAIRLQFGEALEPGFGKIGVSDAAGKQIALAKAAPDKSDPRVMSAALPPLQAGEYIVQWSAVGRDGHRVKGEFRFRVQH
jgi:methionine-rich copper-binding protein CopC